MGGKDSSSNIEYLNSGRMYFSQNIPIELEHELNQVLSSEQGQGNKGVVYGGESVEVRLLEIQAQWANFVDPLIALFKY